ncbi:MAG: very short patch repair endonuclease [Gimesia chilikensis]|uniref:very short patch repair endonuclease n=1 Tax=Gimesia chilikensis TaxID=2605989 RepID=UPI00379FAD4A
MADIVDQKTRSKMMSGIRGKNTKPEIVIRKALFSKGFRYKLHDKKLPGKPDIVLPKYNSVIQINGCFWHGHNCYLFKLPASNTEFWEAKIGRNCQIDKKTIAELKQMGWRVLTIWECAIRGRNKIGLDKVIDLTSDWIRKEGRSVHNIRGKK